MPSTTQQSEVSGVGGGSTSWIGPPGGGSRRGPDTSFPISPKEIATWFLMTGIAMLFGGFASAYIVLRGVPSWESIHLPNLVWGNILMLAAGSVTFEWARRAVKRDAMPAVRQWLSATAILGLAFVVGQIEVWRQMSAAGLFLASSIHSSFFYVLSGIHAIHILGGLIGLGFVIFKAWTDRLSSRSYEPLRLVATYWHFMAGVWLLLLLLLVLA